MRFSSGQKSFCINYPFFLFRLSRARRIIENAFGILTARFGIFSSEIRADPEFVGLYTKAAIVLHNLLMKCSANYCPRGFADTEDAGGNVTKGTWRASVPLHSVERPRGRNYQRGALQVRDEFAEFFYHEGAVPWQIETVNNVGPTLSSSDYDSSSSESSYD